ncbi:hypothetical protein [Paraburkholderia sp. GAS334]|jgi:hypothetical protein|uniref:hypothetical protein n=1 Tax=unclassified Paraburkholderia TaxID=2615204 RepID=UPI003D1A87DC
MDAINQAPDAPERLNERAKARELAEDVRKLLEHENTVLNNRIGWLTAFEGFLFAGFGGMAPKDGKPWENIQIVEAICFTGLGVAVISLLSLIASAIAVDRLLSWWNANAPAAYDGPGVIGWALPTHRWAPFLTVWNFLPLVVGVAWVYLLLVLRNQS